MEHLRQTALSHGLERLQGCLSGAHEGQGCPTNWLGFRQLSRYRCASVLVIKRSDSDSCKLVMTLPSKWRISTHMSLAELSQIVAEPRKRVKQRSFSWVPKPQRVRWPNFDQPGYCRLFLPGIYSG